ncbi:MAG: TatD family hydrolase [Ottowia sp.]|nr:TatD family hydrolase [Ottowia sp.]
MFIDSHCHLDFPQFREHIPDILARMQAMQVSHAMCISVNLPDFPNVLALAQAHTNLYATVGVHPDVEETLEPSVEDLVSRATHPRILGIGETGLDYYRLEGRNIEDMEWQRMRFRTHIRAAREIGKPLIIHTRNAAEDTLRIMREEGANHIGGVLHCFTESWETGKAALDMGFHLSFSGIITFKNAKDLQEIVRKTPLDRMLIETDAPYLAPVPHRGKTNEPSFVHHVGACVAQLKELPIEQIGQITSDNFCRLFRPPHISN